jgi:hypothetical protein
LFGNDDLHSAGFPHKFGFFLGGGNADDPSAANLCHLTEQQTDSSGRCLDQAPVSRLDRVDKMRECVHQESLVHPCRRLLETDAVWYEEQPHG